jgi:hypothetical protein
MKSNSILILCAVGQFAFGFSALGAQRVQDVVTLMDGWRKAHPIVMMETDQKSEKFDAHEKDLVTSQKTETVVQVKKPFPMTSVLFQTNSTLLLYLPDIEKTIVETNEAIRKAAALSDWHSNLTIERMTALGFTPVLVQDAPPYQLRLNFKTPSLNKKAGTVESYIEYTVDADGKITYCRTKIDKQMSEGPVRFTSFNEAEIDTEMAKIPVQTEVDEHLSYNDAIRQVLNRKFGL